MTNNNTMSKGCYLFEHIFWGILTLIWFNNILFRNIEGLTYDQSRHFLWCTIILSLTVGAAITWKKRRNNLSLFVNVIIPYELYSLVAYYHTVCIFTWSLIAVSLLLSIMYVVLVLKPKIRAKARKEAVIKARLVRSFLGTRTVVACCLSIMVLVLGVSSFFGVLFFSPSENPVNRSSGEGVTIAKNIEVVSLLEEKEWSALSTPAKLNVLQTVVNIETYYLGLPHELNVIT